MRWYAEQPARATRQVLADLFVLVWSALWIWAASWVFDLVNKLATPGQKLENGATSLASSLSDAGQRANGVPVVGDSLSRPFESASQASTQVAEAGQGLQDGVRNLAWLLAILIVVLAVGTVVALWLALRLHYLRQATAASRLRDANPDTDLFALRALVQQPLATLVKVEQDPAAAWRRGDPPVVAKLAELELNRWGLRARPG